MRHHHGPRCGCHSCKTIMYPTKYNCVNQYSESTVNHVHPSHTTVMNHHMVKNNHLYPHSTSVQNTTNSVNQYGGSFNVPAPNQQVAGAFSPPGGMGQGPGGQVMGAMSPGYGTGQGPGGQVMGATSPGHGMHHHGNQHGNQWKNQGKWC